MAAYDNVSLPAPPNIATAGNYAQMLMQGLSQLPQDYQRGQDFQYQQRQRDLFKDGLPTNSDGSLDYNAIAKKVIQAGGSQSAAGILSNPLFLGQQGQQVANQAFGGGQSTQPNTGPSASQAGQDPNQLRRTPGGGTPQQPSLSATGGDTSAGAETVRTLTAGIANGRAVPDATMANYARALGVDPDAPLSADQEARARKIIGNNLGGGANYPRIPYGEPSTESGENESGQATQPGGPAGSAPAATVTQGGGAISPNPQGEPTAASFASRFGAATPQAPTARPVQIAQAKAPGEGAYGVPTEPEIRFHQTRGQNMLQASTDPRVNAQQATALRDAGNKELDIAKQMREERAKYFEPTTKEKDVRSGAEGKAAQVAADTKYYDSLHRGLVGSGMIAAQQKQNVDILRQVAASPNFIPGAGSDIALAYQRLAAQFDINPKGAAPREIFNQVAARILADQFSGMKSMAAETGETGGRLFKSMLDIEEKANITPKDTLDGIKAKLDIIDRTGDLMMRWADLADNYKIKHGGLDAGFDKELRADIAKGRVPNVVPKAAGSPGTPTNAGGWKIERVQ